MEMVLQNGFTEMNEEEVLLIDGGGVWGAVVTGLLVAGGIAISCSVAPVGVGALVAKGMSVVGAKLLVGTGIAAEVAAGVAQTVREY